MALRHIYTLPVALKVLNRHLARSFAIASTFEHGRHLSTATGLFEPETRLELLCIVRLHGHLGDSLRHVDVQLASGFILGARLKHFRADAIREVELNG